jgi:hypothetical protein
VIRGYNYRSTVIRQSHASDAAVFARIAADIKSTPKTVGLSGNGVTLRSRQRRNYVNWKSGD